MKNFVVLMSFILSSSLLAGDITSLQINIATADGKTLKNNSLTSLIVSLKEPQSDLKVSLDRFDARMPAHNHGMVVTPKIAPLEGNKWQIDGFKLHMMGQWYFYLDFTMGDQISKVAIPYTLQ